MKLWNKLYLKQKILFIFLPINIISILVILIVCVTVIVNNSKEVMMQNSMDKLSLVADQTDRIISNAKYNIKAFSTSSSLQDAIRANYGNDMYGSFLFSTSMHSSVYNIMDIESLIQNGYIHTYNNKIFDIKSDSVHYTPSDQMLQYYSYITSLGGQIILSSPLDTSGQSAFNLSKSLIDVNNGNCLGMLSFDMKEELFYQAYSKLSQENEEEFMIVSKDGRIISAEDRSLLRTYANSSITDLIEDTQSSFKVYTIDGGKQLTLSMPVKDTDFYVICTVPYFTIFKQAVYLVSILIIIGIVILMTTIVLSKFLADSLVKPLSQLTSYVDAVGDGSLDIPVAVTSSDEIGILAQRFKEMLENIKNLTLDIYNEQNQTREYELRLLQSQINPHFLYNCLDNITTLIEEQENQTASQMLLHLGRYYRAILSKGRNIIAIKEEVWLIKDYLEIQLIKSPHLFTYGIETDPELEDSKILKMLLQPLVENCVIHGFSGFAIKGHIDIRIASNKNDVKITVSDNGRGMSTSMLAQVFTTSSTAVPMHFGLKNVQDRIVLKFGSDYGLSIQSKENEGTAISVCFPKLI